MDLKVFIVKNNTLLTEYTQLQHSRRWNWSGAALANVTSTRRRVLS